MATVYILEDEEKGFIKIGRTIHTASSRAANYKQEHGLNLNLIVRQEFEIDQYLAGPLERLSHKKLGVVPFSSQIVELFQSSSAEGFAAVMAAATELRVQLHADGATSTKLDTICAMDVTQRASDLRDYEEETRRKGREHIKKLQRQQAEKNKLRSEEEKAGNNNDHLKPKTPIPSKKPLMVFK